METGSRSLWSHEIGCSNCVLQAVIQHWCKPWLLSAPITNLFMAFPFFDVACPASRSWSCGSQLLWPDKDMSNNKATKLSENRTGPVDLPSLCRSQWACNYLHFNQWKMEKQDIQNSKSAKLLHSFLARKTNSLAHLAAQSARSRPSGQEMQVPNIFQTVGTFHPKL